MFLYVTALFDVAVVVSAVADGVVVISAVVISDIFILLLMNALHRLLSCKVRIELWLMVLYLWYVWYCFWWWGSLCL